MLGNFELLGVPCRQTDWTWTSNMDDWCCQVSVEERMGDGKGLGLGLNLNRVRRQVRKGRTFQACVSYLSE